MTHANEEDCPCCGNAPRSKADYDRQLVVAFLGGHAASEMKEPIESALCEKHHTYAINAITYAKKMMGES